VEVTKSLRDSAGYQRLIQKGKSLTERLLPYSLLLCFFVFTWHSYSFAETENPFASPRTSDIEDSIPRYEMHRNVRTLVEGLQWGTVFASIMAVANHNIVFGGNPFENPFHVAASVVLATAPLVRANSAIEMERILRRLVAATQADLPPQALEPVQAFLNVEAQKRSMPCSRVAQAANGVRNVVASAMIVGTAYTWRQEIGDAWDQAQDGLDEILWNLRNR